MSRYQEICGCIHIHSPLKRIENTLEPIGREGNRANLDFLIINSHTPKKNSSRYEELFRKENYYGKTLVIKGEETDDGKKQNHLLIIGGSKWYGNREKTAQAVLSEIKKEDCISFVAHPEGSHELFLLKKEYHWEDWETDGFSGIEIWSMLFDWAKETRIYNLPVRYFGFPGNLQGPNPKTLLAWDTLSMARKIVGIAGLDIHALPLFFRPLDVKRSFRYRNIFRVLRNHLLLRNPLNGDVHEDKKKILDALRNGNIFFANDLVADSKGFYFGSEDEDSIMGDTVCADRMLIVRTPLKARVRIVHNGHIISEEETETKRFKPENEGVYRTEVKLGGKPWIFSNHIRVEIERHTLFD